MKKNSIFRYPTISKIMSRACFMALTKCFYVTNPTIYVREKCLLRYEKLGQTRWLIDRIHENNMKIWKLGKMYIIDKMMICYKGPIVHCTSTCFKSLKIGASKYGV
jgi:hypothetical protein